ncbi:O-antigen ligase family protein [Novosphingobium sp.]|uniref:O-antigen ligase family protein n=1 Tax=Novosphingobium sp. TaxID=1874826 RepID=UPI002FDEA45D
MLDDPEVPSPQLVGRNKRSNKSGRANSVFSAGVMTLATLAVFFSVGPFNDQLIRSSNGGFDQVQQYLTIFLWSATGIMSILGPLSRRAGKIPVGLSAFYAYSALSGAWAEKVEDGLLKGAILLVVAVMVYLSTFSLDLKKMMKCVKIATLILCALSWPIAILMPSIGTSGSYYHTGAWEGIFNSKQALGISGAFLAFASMNDFIDRSARQKFSRLLSNLLASVFGITTCVMSESRGAAAIVIVAIFMAYIGKNLANIRKVFVTIPLLTLIAASAMIAYIAGTGHNGFYIIGQEITLTQRTLIWSHAIHHWLDQPLLGFGLNGFWTVDKFNSEFLGQYGWFIANFHSGYVAVLTEVGIIGYVLFFLMTFFLCIRLLSGLSYNKYDEYSKFVLVVGVVIIYTLNLTETFFLRSTNFLNCFLLFIIFKAYGSSEPVLSPKV